MCELVAKIFAAANEVLKDREKKILDLRYGLSDGTARTLEEVGKKFGITRNRVTQIEAHALRKIRRRITCGWTKGEIKEMVELLEAG